jgi:hypothetical protein
MTVKARTSAPRSHIRMEVLRENCMAAHTQAV